MVDHTDDAEVIRQCIWAVVNGPFFPDWRFHALFGFYRDEIRRIAEAWPNWDDNDEQRDAINNTLNNLISGPHDCWDVWHTYISATGPDLCDVYARFRGEPLDLSTKGFCERMS